MKQLLQRKLFCALAMILLMMAGPFSSAYAQKGTIAPEIERLINSDGVPAAQAKFEKMSKSDSLDMNAELTDLGNLTRKYMQTGNQQAGMAVAQMTQQLMIASGMGGMLEASRSPDSSGSNAYENYQNNMQEQIAAKQKQKEAEKEQKRVAEEKRDQERREAAKKERIARLGQPRDDLARFVGMYAPPGNKSRTVFVGVSCDGYLVSGPMWADVSNWVLKSTSDATFTYKAQGSATEVNFEFSGKSGVGMQLVHNIHKTKSPMFSYDSSPEDIPDCIK
jgi:hypothetical protein